MCQEKHDPAGTLQDLISELYSFGNEYLNPDEQVVPDAKKISINLGTMEEMETAPGMF